MKEIRNPFKIYFWDVGIWNAVLDNFSSLSLRDDVGRLWENFCISERIKLNSNQNIHKKYYFWRTDDKKEYDLTEETEGTFEVFEIKWSETKKAKHYQEFFDVYPVKNETGKAFVINRDNIGDWLI